MTRRQLPILDLHIRGADVAPVGTGGAVDCATRIESHQPSWNSSTMCVQAIHRRMSVQGWNGQEMELPRFEGGVGELPKRPLDLGVGWWR